MSKATAYLVFPVGRCGPHADIRGAPQVGRLEGEADQWVGRVASGRRAMDSVS
jgi:hypothetical protein